MVGWRTVAAAALVVAEDLVAIKLVRLADNEQELLH